MRGAWHGRGCGSRAAKICFSFFFKKFLIQYCKSIPGARDGGVRGGRGMAGVWLLGGQIFFFKFFILFFLFSNFFCGGGNMSAVVVARRLQNFFKKFQFFNFFLIFQY